MENEADGGRGREGGEEVGPRKGRAYKSGSQYKTLQHLPSFECLKAAAGQLHFGKK